MSLEAQITALAQEIGIDMKSALAGGGGGFTQTRFRSENTNTTTNLNASTAAFTTIVPITGNVTKNDTDFTVNGNGVNVNFTGRIMLISNVKYTVSGARVAVQIRARINGTPIGVIGSTGYVRNSSGHNESSLHIMDEFDVITGDLIEIGSRRESSATTSTPMNPAGGSNLILIRVE